MLVHLRQVAPTLNGPLLIDEAGLPRYWAAVWASFLPADLARSTVDKKLRYLESFYQHSDEVLGNGRLDDALADLDLELLSCALEGFFLRVRNQAAISQASEERWQAALQFVTQIAERMAKSPYDIQRTGDLQSRLMRLELLHSKLHVGRRGRPERIRSLPSEVVEFLYELLDPESRANPFRDGASRWRVYVLFILMLHQGLRRGELLVLPADVIKSSFDHRLHQDRFWITVKCNDYEEDHRYSTPGIKTPSSIRQIPVSPYIALIVQEYVSNYRGRTGHSFLVSSQKGKPMSTEGVTKIFQKVNTSLPQSLRKILQDQTGCGSITAHSLRHTCAVVRLNQLLSDGVGMEDAMQQIRVFFGWSRESDMPLRYARAVFEDRLASVWRSEFDDRVSVLRSLPARLK